MPRVLIVGGSGQIGRAAARAMADTGWQVVIASRSGALPDGLAERGVQVARADRTVEGAVEALVGDGVDVLVDVVAFTRNDAEQLLALRDRVQSYVVLSSASVYTDDEGRTFDEATSAATFPRYPVPIPETQRTTDPSDATYSTRKVEIEQVLLAADADVSVIRPGAVHGPGAELPRELFFVRRALDGRKKAVLVSNGESLFHTTSAVNLAELIRMAAEKPGTRVLNCGDPEPPTVRQIGEAIGSALGHEFELIGIPEDGHTRPELGNPWGVPLPLVLEMTAAARELGYEPVATYAEAVRETCDWLVPEAYRDWSATYLQRYLDYSAEDAMLAEIG